MIPNHLRPLFWDVNPQDFRPAAHPRYTIERVLEHGEEDDVAWLTRVFTREQIRDVLRTDRRLSPRSANFWALVFDLPIGDVAALQR
ncbi:MAG: hypothetical protein GEU99_17440 [Luteitalea sp.]|nr:hypothetical protein [Luteitalea sp.]